MKQLIRTIAISVAASTMAVGAQAAGYPWKDHAAPYVFALKMKLTLTSKPERRRRAACPRPLRPVHRFGDDGRTAGCPSRRLRGRSVRRRMALERNIRGRGVPISRRRRSSGVARRSQGHPAAGRVLRTSIGSVTCRPVPARPGKAICSSFTPSNRSVSSITPQPKPVHARRGAGLQFDRASTSRLT